MKKNRILLLLLVLLFIFTACGEKINTNETSIVIKKKNSIISAIIEDFDKDYYSEDKKNSNKNLAEFAKQKNKLKFKKSKPKLIMRLDRHFARRLSF